MTKFFKREREREREEKRREERTTSAKEKQSVFLQFLISKGVFGPSSNVVVVMKILVWS